MQTKSSWLPYLSLFGGILALSFSSLFVRWADAPGVMTSCYRMLLATLFLFPIFFRNVRKQGFPSARLLIFPFLGGLFTTLDHGFWSTAIERTFVANATLLNNISPLWVALVAVFLWGERLNGKFWLGLVFTLCGAAIVLSSDFVKHPQFSSGDILAIISSVFYAGYFLVTQKGRAKLDTITYIWLMELMSGLMFLGYTQAVGIPLFGYSKMTYLTFLGAALISQVGGYFMVSYALGHLPASLVSPTMIAQPVLTAILAIPLAGEMLSMEQLLGGTAVLGGIYLVNTAQKKKKPVLSQSLE